MKNILQFLELNPLFRNMSLGEIESALSCLAAREAFFDKNVFIFEPETTKPSIGIILTGGVVIFKEDFWGNRSILTKLGAGDIFGEAFTCARTELLPVGALATERSRVLFVDYRKTLDAPSLLFPSQSKLAHNMLVILAAKNVMLTQKIEHLMKRSTRDKLLSYLSAQALTHGGPSFDIPLNRQELADYLAVDRSAMSNELGKLRKEGLLSYTRSHFELLT
ncbi:MAG: Crp/Fnr family transcriptional regulator [Acholeplasmataceae bacterium]|nr:Crp/Fnr family transcriptional regulator [Acholeplasmataceae bacterium]